jgi:predicted peptidase
MVSSVQEDWLFLHHYNNRLTYNFYVYLPLEFWEKDTETFPLVLFLHGDGGDRSYVPDPYPEMLSGGPLKPLYDTSKKCIVDNRAGLNALVAKAIVIYPKVAQIDDTYGNLLGYWNPTVINRLFDDVVEMYRVDRKRIYVTGLSFGGGGTWYYANDNDRVEYTPRRHCPDLQRPQHVFKIYRRSSNTGLDFSML